MMFPPSLSLSLTTTLSVRAATAQTKGRFVGLIQIASQIKNASSIALHSLSSSIYLSSQSGEVRLNDLAPR